MKQPRSIIEIYISDRNWAFDNVASIYAKLELETIKEIFQLNDNPITRELLAQILYEVTNGELKQTVQKNEFTDIGKYKHQNAINYCISTGILKGVSETTIEPEKPLTRAELMTVLIRLDEMLKSNVINKKAV